MANAVYRRIFDDVFAKTSTEKPIRRDVFALYSGGPDPTQHNQGTHPKITNELISITHAPVARDIIQCFASCKEGECTAGASSVISQLRYCMKCQLCRILAVILMLATLVNLTRKRRVAGGRDYS